MPKLNIHRSLTVVPFMGIHSSPGFVALGPLLLTLSAPSPAAANPFVIGPVESAGALMVEPVVITLVLGLLGYRALRLALIWSLVTLVTFLGIVLPTVGLLSLAESLELGAQGTLVAAGFLGAEALVVCVEAFALKGLCARPWFQGRARGDLSWPSVFTLVLVANLCSVATPFLLALR